MLLLLRWLGADERAFQPMIRLAQWRREELRRIVASSQGRCPTGNEMRCQKRAMLLAMWTLAGQRSTFDWPMKAGWKWATFVAAPPTLKAPPWVITAWLVAVSQAER